MKRSILFLLLCFMFFLLARPFLWSETTITLGTATTYNMNISYPTPYGTLFRNHRQQYLILANELYALGGGAGDINALSFNVHALNTCASMPRYRIRMKHTLQNALTTTFEIGEYQQVWYQLSFMPVLGWNNHVFDIPFEWDGISNILIDIVYWPVVDDTQNASVYYTATTGTNSALYYYTNDGFADEATTGIASTHRANMQITMQSANQNDLAAIDINGPSTVYVGQTSYYNITILNLGTNTQNNYTVKLMKEGDVELASTVVTDSLEFLEENEVVFTWIPDVSMVGETYLYGQVALLDDENPDNDYTAHHDVTIHQTVIVSGFINANNSPAGLDGADIFITGDFNYELLNAPANWQISHVVANQTYFLTIEAEGYQTHSRHFLVSTSNFNLGTITLNEVTEPVYNVTAELINNDREVSLNWMTSDTSYYYNPSDMRITDEDTVSEDWLSRTRELEGYVVYRFLSGDVYDPELWELIENIPLGITTYIDNVTTLQNGYYRWAIRSLYTGGLLSEPALSNIIHLYRDPVFAIIPHEHNFGYVLVNEQTDPLLFTAFNNGGGILTLTSIYISGDFDDFTYNNIDGVILPLELGPQEAFRFTVSFNPSSEGPKSFVISIEDDVWRYYHNIYINGYGVDVHYHPPWNLTAIKEGNDIELNWDDPIIHYDTGINAIGIGYESGTNQQMVVATRYETDYLTNFDGMSLKYIVFFPRESNTNYYVIVWTGGSFDGSNFDHGNIVAFQYVPSPHLMAMNYVVLEDPVLIDGSEELWIGCYAVTDMLPPWYPFGADAGPVFENKGDLISGPNGFMSHGMNNNWNIQGFVIYGESTYETIRPEGISLGEWDSFNSIIGQNRQTVIPTRQITGYNIYRDEELINTITNPLITSYLDEELAYGIYIYQLQALYGSHLSDITEPVYGIMTEDGDPLFNYDPTAIDYGVIQVNTDNEASLTITNQGGGILHVNIGLPQDLLSSSNNLALVTDETIEIVFTLNRSVLFDYDELITFTTSDPLQPVVYIPVSAYVSIDPMSGIYVIDHAGFGDFLSFTEAVSALLNMGVAGPVTYEVTPGFYYEQVNIPSIVGSSETNTITFTGLEAREKPTVVFAPTEAYARHIFRLYGAKHIRLNNLEIVSMPFESEYGWPIHLTADFNGNINENIEITNCYLLTNATSSSSNFSGIVATSVYSPPYVETANVNGLLIENNTIEGGYYGMSFIGEDLTNPAQNISIINNNIVDFYGKGINTLYVKAPVIQHNKISARSSGNHSLLSTGINLIYSEEYNISYNTIGPVGNWGIYVYNTDLFAENTSFIYNNMLSGFLNLEAVGILLFSGSNIEVIYNSINVVNVSTNGNGIAFYVGFNISGLKVFNNSFSFSVSEDGFAAYYYNIDCLLLHDYNNYYNGTSSNFVYYGTEIADLAALQAVNIPPGNDQNSYDGDPGYLSATDLHASGFQLYGRAYPVIGIDDDIDGDIRDPLNPCIGADEFIPPVMLYISSTTTQDETGLISRGSDNQQIIGVQVVTEGYLNPLVVNSITFSTDGTTDTDDLVSVKVWYTGNDPIFETTYQVGDTIISPEGIFVVDVEQQLQDGTNFFWLTYDISEGAIIGHFVDATCNSLVINNDFYLPDITDPMGNRMIGEVMSGIYTIKQDGTGDFTSFNEAIDIMYLVSIDGPVIFEVYPGTYTEQILFNGEIPGASETNTIIFTGVEGIREGPVLNFTPTENNARHVIKIIEAKHLRINNLKIEVLDTATYGWGIHIMQNSQDIEVTNCEIITSTASLNPYNYQGIIISGSHTEQYIGASNVSDILIENNLIVGGYYSISMRGISIADNLHGVWIINNDLLEAYVCGIEIFYVTEPIIKNNQIDLRIVEPTATTRSGVYLNQLYGPFELSHNTIINPGRYGIFITNALGIVGTPSRIFNNMVGGGFTHTSPGNAAGIHLHHYTQNLNVYYNSVNLDKGSGSAIYCEVNTANIRVLNNSFAYSGPDNGYAAYYVTTSPLIEHNYNNFYVGTSSAFVYFSSEKGNLDELQAIGLDLNSYVGNPEYFSVTDLHSVSPQLIGRGIPITGINDDIDGDLRDPITPCIGADEYVLLDHDLSTSAINGDLTGVVGMELSYNIYVHNLSSSTLHNFTVMLMHEDTVLASELITTPIFTGELIIYQLTWIPLTEGIYNVHGYVFLPSDINPDNDSTYNNFNVYIYPEGTNLFNIGNSLSGDNILPLNFSYKNSLTETIYPVYQLNLPVGAEISKIGYFNDFDTNLPNREVKFWIGETELTDLEADWITADNLTQVFDGTVNFPQGNNMILIELQTPYFYNGGNLVIMANRVFENQNYSADNLFNRFISYNNRSRYASSNVTVYDPYTITGADGFYINEVPNTTFFYNLGSEQLETPILDIQIIASDVVLSWNDITGANSYYIYASEDPYAEDWGDPIAQVGVNMYMEPVTNRKFFRVIASSDLPPVRGITPLSIPNNSRR